MVDPGCLPAMTRNAEIPTGGIPFRPARHSPLSSTFWSSGQATGADGRDVYVISSSPCLVQAKQGSRLHPRMLLAEWRIAVDAA